MMLRLLYGKINTLLICVAAIIFGTFGFLGCGESKGSGKTANSGNDTTFYIGNVPIAMVFVQGGKFTMGCTSEQGDDCRSEKAYSEYPAHRVTVSGFYIGKYEVTEDLWKEIMVTDETEYETKYRYIYMKPEWESLLPVTYVSWEDVQEFITKLNAKTDKTFRLPTEAEWEYAARGGKKSKGYKYSGSNNIDDVAWYEGNAENWPYGEELLDFWGKRLKPELYDIIEKMMFLDRGRGRMGNIKGYLQFVGTRQPNELGIHDMNGNAEEWVNDWYEPYTADSKKNPVGPSSPGYHVVRGGNYNDKAEFCRVSSRRDGSSPVFYYAPVGFRLAHDAKQEGQK